MVVCVAFISSIAVVINVAPTKMVSSTMAADRELVGAVFIRGTPYLAILPGTVVAVFMVGGRVDAGLIEADTQLVVMVAANVFTLMVVQVTDVAVVGQAVSVGIAATQVLAAAMAADRVGLGAVLISAATISTLQIVNVAVVAVLVIGEVTLHIHR
jgi:hypothetical protein